MVDIPEFAAPDFLQNQDEDTIHSEMLDSLPADMDKGEGGFPWDLTRPTAIQNAKLISFDLLEALKSLFPMWAYSNMLDYHADCRGTSRKPAVSATATVTITGEGGTVIEKGFRFCTEATANSPSIEFETQDDIVIPSEGSVPASVVAVNAGASGNVGANTIILQTLPQSGIDSVTNPAAATGGIDQEGDEALRQRLVEFDRSLGNSFAGTPSDYSRWAMEVNGVGSVNVIPAGNTSGLVTLIIVDSNGTPASIELCTAIYNHIMRPDSPKDRLAPINANLSVEPPATVQINVNATVVLASGVVLEDVKAAFLKELKDYLLNCTEMVYFSKIAAALVNTSGVKDYSVLTVNDGEENIPIANGEMATTDETRVILNV